MMSLKSVDGGLKAQASGIRLSFDWFPESRQQKKTDRLCHWNCNQISNCVYVLVFFK